MKYVWVIALIFAFVTASNASEWISFSQASTRSASKSLISDSGNTIRLNFTVPGISLEKVDINGEQHVKLGLPDSSVLIDKGVPELRKLTSFVAIPGRSNYTVSIEDMQFTEISIVPIAPSKGRILRDTDPETVPYEFGDIYRSSDWFPAESDLASVSKPFIFRDVNGVRVSVVPFQYNHAEKKLKVITSMTVVLHAATSKHLDVSYQKPCKSKAFEALYKDVFINYRPAVSKGLTAPEEKKELLIISHADFMDACQELKQWKTKAGFNVELVSVEDAGGSAEGIKSFLQAKYDEGKLCFIVLVGDSDHIPTLKGVCEGADSDPCYVKLAGDDHLMDAFISRISVESKDQAEYVIQKSIHYEQYPMQGADAGWYKRGLSVASSETDGSGPKDFERANELNAELIAKLGFEKVTECYEPDGGGYDDWSDWDYDGYEEWEEYKSFSRDTEEVEDTDETETDDTSDHNDDKQIVHNAVNEGVSIINYIGHGSISSWGTSGFSNNDCDQLQNGMKLPVVWSVACVNGAYVGETCFAEAWLRAGSKENQAGCIGIAAATTNMAWVPPCVWQKHIVFEEMCQKKHNIACVQHLYGVLKCMEEYGTDDSSDGNMLSEQTHYFGDGTVTLRFEAPRTINIENRSSNESVELTISGADTEQLTVTVYDENLESVRIATPDSRGNVRIEKGNATMFTVTGPDIVPVIDEQL